MYKDFKKSETLDTGFTSGSSLIWMFSGIVLGLLVGLGMYFFTNDKIPSISMIDSLEKKIQHVQTEELTNKQLKNTTNSTSESNNQQNLNTQKQQVEEKQRKNKFSYYAVLPNLHVPVGSAKPINTSESAVSVKNTDADTDKPLSEQYIDAVEKQNNKTEQTDEILYVEKKKSVTEENTTLIGDYLLQVASFKRESMADKTKGHLSNKGIDAYIQKKKIKGRYWYRVIAGPVDQNSVDSWKHTAEELGHKPLIISVR